MGMQERVAAPAVSMITATTTAVAAAVVAAEEGAVATVAVAAELFGGCDHTAGDTNCVA